MAWEQHQQEGRDCDTVFTMAGEKFEPWRTFADSCGAWKFPQGLMSFLEGEGFRAPTPIQAHTWPPLVKGNDVIGVAKTGSGKTLGYLLPGYVKVKRAEGESGLSCDYRNGPAMLVMAPTRELCQQIFDESVKFGNPANIVTACCYGGAPKREQSSQLWKGPHCVVATPGRLNDFCKEGTIKLGQVMYLVLDEADRMLDMGFEVQIRETAQYLPAKRQTALFTATWPKEVQKIAAGLTNHATHIQVGSTDTSAANADITQHVKLVRSERDKMDFLEKSIFPLIQQSGGSALIFTNTKRAVQQLWHQLHRAGAPIVRLQGDMEQRERDEALRNFKDGRAKVLVATDVAQRGLDIKNVQFVVNYDMPSNTEDYVHRIGRTGRAGEKGDAYTFLYESDTRHAENIMKSMRKSGQAVPAEVEQIARGGGGGYGGGGGGYGGGGANLDAGWGNYRAGGGGGGGGKGGWGGY